MKTLSEEKCKEIAKSVIKTKYPMITVGIISTESGFNRKARNKNSGCIGLGQIHPVHKNELKKAGIINKFDDLYNIKNNVEAINFVFNQKLDITNGNIKKALQLYSGDARNYHKKVLNKTKDIRNYFSES
jgi:soluble lytic murein transglycosylase-like protein